MKQITQNYYNAYFSYVNNMISSVLTGNNGMSVVSLNNHVLSDVTSAQCLLSELFQVQEQLNNTNHTEIL